MGILRELRIVQGNSKTAEIFESLFTDFRQVEYSYPSEYVKFYWDAYQQTPYKKNKGLNGKMLELIVATLLCREKVTPFYLNAKVTFVNDVRYDLTLYNQSKGTPIVLSMKTTLRERYKQAEHEALKLKDVHKGAKSYLIMIDDNYKHYLKKKEEGSIRLNEIIYAFSAEFDSFIYHLKGTTMGLAPTVPVIKSNMIVSA